MDVESVESVVTIVVGPVERERKNQHYSLQVANSEIMISMLQKGSPRLEYKAVTHYTENNTKTFCDTEKTWKSHWKILTEDTIVIIQNNHTEIFFFVVQEHWNHTEKC